MLGGEKLPVPKSPEDKDAMPKLLDGFDAVVHLGGVSTEQPWDPILAGNIVGAYNLYEAARIDGLNEYGIWARIILPLSKPAIATLAIFTFVNTWNDYMGPMIYLTSDANKTIQVGLRRFIQAYSADYHLIMAASLCSLIPVSVVFPSLQKYFIEGIATTGLKG